MDLPVAGHVRMAEQLFVPPLLPAVYTGSAGGMSGAEMRLDRCSRCFYNKKRAENAVSSAYYRYEEGIR